MPGPVTALIKITQGAATDIAGRAVKGSTSGGTAVFSNGDNTNVVNWKYELTYTPPGSAIPTAIQGPGGTSTFTMAQPDRPGSYRMKLTVDDGGVNSDVDIRCLVVPFPTRGFLIGPYQGVPQPLPLEGPNAKPHELNVGGQSYGWDGDDDPSRLFMYQIIEILDGFAAGGVTDHNSLTGRELDAAHTQFLLLSGTRPMAGNLNMDSNGVVNGTYNGVNLTDAGDGSLVLTDDGSYAAVGADENAIHDNVAGEFDAIDYKTSPVPADLILLEDSAAGFAKVTATLASILLGVNTVTFAPAALSPTAGAATWDLSTKQLATITITEPTSITLDGPAGGHSAVFTLRVIGSFAVTFVAGTGVSAIWPTADNPFTPVNEAIFSVVILGGKASIVMKTEAA